MEEEKITTDIRKQLDIIALDNKTEAEIREEMLGQTIELSPNTMGIVKSILAIVHDGPHGIYHVIIEYDILAPSATVTPTKKIHSPNAKKYMQGSKTSKKSSNK